MAAILSRALAGLLAGALTACASGGDGDERRPAPERRRAAEAGVLHLEMLDPQPLDPGQCGLFLWMQGGQEPVFVFAAFDDIGEARVYTQGRERILRRQSFEGSARMGHFERQTFVDERLTITADVVFDDQQTIEDGVALRSGVLRVRDRDGWEAITPVGGMVACER